MADIAESRIHGLDGVVEKMRSLAPRLQRNGLRKAARKAMNIVRDAAREKARAVDDPETPEKIWKNIITQESAKEGRREGGVVMKVGVRGGASRNQHSKDASGKPGTGAIWSSAPSTRRRSHSCGLRYQRTLRRSLIGSCPN